MHNPWNLLSSTRIVHTGGVMIRLIFLAGVSLLAVGGAFADISAVGPPPPLAQPVTITAFKGEETRIPLRALGRASNSAKFLIRSLPKQGELSPVQPAGPGSAFVIYRHKGNTAPAQDVFTFAAQSKDSPVSAPARVIVQIRERPAVFRAPASLRFPVTTLGKEWRERLVLKNEGGEMLQGTAKVDEGWYLPNPEYQIPGGSEKSMEVVFRPEEARQFAGMLRFSHDSKALVQLAGEAVNAFTVSPVEIQLRGEGGKPSATLTLQNHTAEDLPVSITGKLSIGLPEEVVLPPLGTVVLPVSSARQDAVGGKDRVRFSHPLGFVEVPVVVYPLPGKLLLEPGEGKDFGLVEPGASLEYPIRFFNDGGLPVRVSLQASPPAWVRGPLALLIAPGQSEVVTAGMDCSSSGDQSGTIVVRWEEQEFPIHLKAKVDRPESPAERREALPGKMPASAALQPPQEQIAGEASFDKIRLVAANRNTVSIEWDDASSANPRHVIEKREFSAAPQGGVAIRWIPVPNVQITNLGNNTFRGTFFGMRPGEQLMIRIVTLGPDGQPETFSSQFPIASTPPPPERSLPWGWLLLVVLPVAAFFLRQKFVRNQRERDLRRLQKLERGV